MDTNIVNAGRTWLTPLMFLCPGSTTWIFQPRFLCVKHWIIRSYMILKSSRKIEILIKLFTTKIIYVFAGNRSRFRLFNSHKFIPDSKLNPECPFPRSIWAWRARPSRIWARAFRRSSRTSCNYPRYPPWCGPIRNNGRLRLGKYIRRFRVEYQQILFRSFLSLCFVRDHPPDYQLYIMDDTYIESIWTFHNNMFHNVILWTLHRSWSNLALYMYFEEQFYYRK